MTIHGNVLTFYGMFLLLTHKSYFWFWQVGNYASFTLQLLRSKFIDGFSLSSSPASLSIDYVHGVGNRPMHSIENVLFQCGTPLFLIGLMPRLYWTDELTIKSIRGLVLILSCPHGPRDWGTSLVTCDPKNNCFARIKNSMALRWIVNADKRL